jgi:hypothetical protein
VENKISSYVTYPTLSLKSSMLLILDELRYSSPVALRLGADILAARKFNKVVFPDPEGPRMTVN